MVVNFWINVRNTIHVAALFGFNTTIITLFFFILMDILRRRRIEEREVHYRYLVLTLTATVLNFIIDSMTIDYLPKEDEPIEIKEHEDL